MPLLISARPSVAGAVWRGNEPGGMTMVDERPFDTLDEHISPHVPGWDTDATLQIITDATAPKSPSNVIQVPFPAGLVDTVSPVGHTGVQWSGGQRTLYVCYYTKYSSNWQGHPTFSKQLYCWINATRTPIFFGAKGSGASALSPQPVMQATVNYDGFYAPNLVPGAVFTRNQWDLVELILVGNTAGTADGSFDWYLNGVHIGSLTGIQWDAGACVWNIFELNPVWGGNQGATVTNDMWLWWDHVYLSKK